VAQLEFGQAIIRDILEKLSFNNNYFILLIEFIDPGNIAIKLTASLESLLIMNRVMIGIMAILIFLFVYVSGFYGFQIFYNPHPYKVMSVKETVQLIDANTEERVEIVLIDVRDVDMYDKGHIKGAVNIPLQYLEAAIGNLDHYENDLILVYSQNGIAGTNASQIFTDNGFSRVYNLDGGISAWIEEGLPIIPTEISEGCKECGNN
jgi:rhodanese-related sulfurtransferase